MSVVVGRISMLGFDRVRVLESNSAAIVRWGEVYVGGG